jgi:hypothetical protein
MALGPVSVGTPPDPTRYPHWREYAAALADFYAQQARISQGVQPTAVQLVHVNIAAAAVKDRPRATQDGILAFDPTLGAPVVSVGGVWKTVTLT